MEGTWIRAPPSNSPISSSWRVDHGEYMDKGVPSNSPISSSWRVGGQVLEGNTLLALLYHHLIVATLLEK